MKQLLSLLLVFSINVCLQAKTFNPEPAFQEIEKLYEKGEYKKGLDKTESLMASLKGGAAYMELLKIRAHYWKAAFLSAKCMFDSYKKQIEYTNPLLEKADKSNTDAYVQVLLTATLAYLDYTDFLEADKAIAKGRKLMEEGKLTNPVLRTQLLYYDAVVKMKQGYILKAEKTIDEGLIEAKKIIATKETQIVKGKSKSIKLSKKEIANRKIWYGHFLNLQVKVLLKEGNLSEADSLSLKNKSWIKAECKPKSVPYVVSLFQQALIQQQNDENKKSLTSIREALRYGQFVYKVYGKGMYDIHSVLLPAYKENGLNNLYQKRNKFTDQQVRRYYGKNSMAYQKTFLIDVDKLIIQGKGEEAEELLNNFLKNYYIPPAHEDKIQALEKLAYIYNHTDRLGKQEEMLKTLSALRKTINGDLAPVYHIALMNQAAYQLTYGDNFKYLDTLFTQSLEGVIKKEVSSTNIDYLNAVYSQARFYELSDRYAESDKILQKAVNDISQSQKNETTTLANALQKQAQLQAAMGKFLNAQATIQRSITIFDKKYKSKDVPEYLEALLTKTRLEIFLADFNEARKTLRKATSLTNELSKELSRNNTNIKATRKVSGAALENAILNIRSEKYQSAQEMLDELVALREQRFGKEHRSLVEPLLQLGYLDYYRDNFQDAEKICDRVSKISQKLYGENSSAYARCLNLKQTIYSKVGDYENAERTCQRAYEIQNKVLGQNHVELAVTLSRLALIKHYYGRSDQEIEKLFDQALTIVRTNLSDKHVQYAEILKDMIRYKLDRNKKEGIETLIDQANKIYTDKLGNDNKESAHLYSLRAKAAYLKGNYQQASDYLVKSKTIFSTILGDKHEDYLQALSTLAQMQYILGNRKSSVQYADEVLDKSLEYVDKYFSTLSESGKQKYYDKLKPNLEFYKFLAFTSNKEYPDMVGKAYNLTLKTKAILLNASVKMRDRILKSGDSSLIQLFNKWLDKKELLVSALSMSQTEKADEGIDIGVINLEIEILEKQLSEKSDAFALAYKKKTNLYDWHELKKILNSGECAVEIVAFRYFDTKFTDSTLYAIMSVNSSTRSNPDLTILSNGRALDTRYLRYYRNCMRSGITDRISYNMYWKPIQELIKDNKTIYLSCDGVYNQINLETLIDGDDQYNLQKYNIILISSTRDLLDNMTARKRGKRKGNFVSSINIFANPVYYSKAAVEGENRISPLPGTAKEAKNIEEMLRKSQWKTELSLEQQASEANIKKLQNPGVFHVATHGFFKEEKKDSTTKSQSTDALPLWRSGLILQNGGKLIESSNVLDYNREDGILTAYEAMSLNFDSTQLVVLSACETGLGEVQMGEGVMGLQRAFLVAGSESVIMSLFKVSDEVTSELMTTFYQKWVLTGDKRNSFLEAKKAIKEKYPEPKYWGSFIMVGVN